MESEVADRRPELRLAAGSRRVTEEIRRRGTKFQPGQVPYRDDDGRWVQDE